MKVKNDFLRFGIFKIRNGTQVIHTIFYWLRTWAVLQKSNSRLFMVEATQRLMQVAKVFFPRNMGGSLVFGLIVTRVCKCMWSFF
jgi:hypothetical protein